MQQNTALIPALIPPFILNCLELCGYSKECPWTNCFFQQQIFQQTNFKYEHEINTIPTNDLCALGLFYQYGIGTKIDLERAECLLQRAANTGHNLACEMVMILGLEYVARGDQQRGESLMSSVNDKVQPERSVKIAKHYGRWQRGESITFPYGKFDRPMVKLQISSEKRPSLDATTSRIEDSSGAADSSNVQSQRENEEPSTSSGPCKLQ